MNPLGRKQWWALAAFAILVPQTRQLCLGSYSTNSYQYQTYHLTVTDYHHLIIMALDG